MQKSYFRKLLTLLLVLCMSLTYMPSFVFAAEGDVPTETQQTTTEAAGEEQSQNENNTTETNNTTESTETATESSQDDASSTDVNPAGPIRAPALKAAGDGEEGDDGTGIETDEEVDLPEDAQDVTFVIEGADSLDLWIEGVSESQFTRDETTGDIIVDYDINVRDGDLKKLSPNSDIIIKGIDGKCLNVGVGNDLDNAKQIDTVSEAGKYATVGTTGECTVYVKVTDTPESTGESLDGDPDDENATVNYDFISSDDDEGKYYGSGDPDVSSSIKKGDKFTGSATCVSWTYNWGSGPSHAKIKCTTGKLKGKVVGTACISGKSKALALKGAKFTYVATVVSVDAKTGKVKYNVKFYPRDRKNVSYGTLSNFHVATQKMAGTVTLSHTPQIDIKITKVDEQTHYNYPGNYNVNGATFQVYSDDACTQPVSDVKGNNALLTVTADATGHRGESQTITIANPEDKDFYVNEINVPKGYHSAGIGTVQDDMTVVETPIMPYVQVVKEPAKTDTDYLQFPNNYTLKGAEYTMYTDAACTKIAKDASGKNVVFTTDILGNTTPVRVDLGKYWIKETKASKGYMLDPDVKSIELTAAHEKTPLVVKSTEQPRWAPFKMTLEKMSQEFGYARLLDAEYEISYYDADNTLTDVSGLTPTRTWKFKTHEVTKTDKSGHSYKTAGIDFTNDTPIEGGELYSENGEKIMPLGLFSVKEVKAPRGLEKDKTVYVGKVVANDDAQTGAIASINGKDKLDIVIDNEEFASLHEEDEAHITLTVNKKDAETGKAEPQGQASEERLADFGSLAGATYDVYMDDPTESSAVKVGQIVTDAEGKGSLTTDSRTNRRLMPGTYLIKEVKASPGYTVDSLYYEDKADVYEDGKHIVVARNSENVEDLEYTVESLELPHHTKISKTDITTGEELPGALLQVINSEGTVVEQWTSTDKVHDIVALPDGTYTLREITAPYGYDVAEDIEFTVKADVVENEVEMKNKPITIGTTAMDEATKSHQGTFTEDEVITDTVKVTGLYEGREYRIHGVLMDKATKEAVKDASGKEVTAEKSFTATGDEMEIELEFTVNSSEFTTDSVTVAFEYLERTKKVHEVEADVVPVELQKHEDINDEDQTIHYGGIVGTTAVDKASKSHNILAAKDVTIVDTVKFENLSTKSEYEVKGELFDKTTGKLTGIKSSAKFTPETPDGTVDVEFKFDASELANHDIVVYETLLINNIEINKHENPDDEDQTVHVPEIHTTATDVKTGDHIANGSEDVQIKDVVEYKNLIPGKEYTMEGTLMNQKTGKAVENDGKAVTASVKFTPETKDGTVELTFKFNGVDLRGVTVVAFEECKVTGVPVAVHADINDEEQSVQIPEIGTKAARTEKETITDEVEYTNLIPGKTYVMFGYLVDKDTEEAIEGTETEVEFTPDKPNGKLDVEIEFDLSELKGHDVVCFEKCYLKTTTEGVEEPKLDLVGSHMDIDDDNQTVEIPSDGVKTGDDYIVFLFGAAFMLSTGLFLVLRKKAALRK